MNVLVTGGTGFTGSHLVRRLLEDGHDVLALDNAKGLFFEELGDLGATMRLGSIEDPDFCRQAVEESKADVVYHLAAAFRKIDANKELYWRVNVEGTRHLCENSYENGVRKFVYCSTQGVHGHIQNPPGHEDSPIAPADYYQYTKWEGERVVNDIVTRTGFEATTVRPTAIYGPGDPERFFMLFRRCSAGAFPMFGSGETTYHPVYIDNLVDCFLLAAEKGRPGQAYIAADEHYYTLNDLVRLVGRSIGVDVKLRHYPYWPLYLASTGCELACKPLRIAPPLFRRRASWFRQVRAFSIDKAKSELGYEPRIGILEGLVRTADWYRENGYLSSNLIGPTVEEARAEDTELATA
jgi:nucleoside-diphosphate-sugar epimerase